MKRTEARAEARANLVGACYCHECMAGVRKVRPRAMGCEPTMTTNERIEAAAVDPSFRFVTCKKVAAAQGMTLAQLGTLPEARLRELYREAAERIYGLLPC